MCQGKMLKLAYTVVYGEVLQLEFNYCPPELTWVDKMTHCHEVINICY